MAWMSLSPLTPVALTTPRFLRWCSGSLWTTGSMTPFAVWWVALLSLSQSSVSVCYSDWLAVMKYPFLCCAGMVQPGPGVCLGWVLCQEWGSRLSQTSVLPAWSTGKSGKRGYYWPHSSTLQLCVLCLPCPWEQVCPNPIIVCYCVILDLYAHKNHFEHLQILFL